MDRIEPNDQATGDAASTLPMGQAKPHGLLDATALAAATAMAAAPASLTLADYIPDPVGRQLRVSLVKPHLTHAEGKWTGYPAEPGFQVVTVTTASALMSAIMNAAGQSRIIECNWDGISETAAGATGRAASTLTGNSGVDWGYNRSATNILVRPKAGRTPRVRGTSGQTAAGALNGQVSLTGVSRIEVRDLVFDGCRVSLGRNSTYPEIAMAVFKRCTFLNHKADSSGTVHAQGVRLLHVEDCLFDGCAMGILHSAHFMRSINNGFVRAFNQDIHAARSYTQPYQRNWDANIWIAGSVVWALDAQSSAHLDFAQISTSQVEVHKGYKQLVEFCVFYGDNGTSTSTQAIFGDDGAAQGYRCDHLVHNNVFAFGAYWGVVAYDPSDDGTKVVTRNVVARVGSGFGYGDAGGPQTDTYCRIIGERGGQPTGTGRMIVSENYFTLEADDCRRAKDDDNRWDNIKLDPRAGAVVATRPETVLMGNGTWAKSAAGRTTYADPAPATLGKAEAKAALLAFFQPKAGWRGAGAGPVNPASWPANPAAVPTGPTTWAPDRVLTSQWAVADAATGDAARLTVFSLAPNVTGLGVVVDGASPIPLAAPLVGTHALAGLTNFAHAFSLVASNANGASGPSAAKTCNVTDGTSLFDFEGLKPTLTSAATCSAIPGGWQWTTSSTGPRSLYWNVNGVMIPGNIYRLDLELEASSLADAVSARCASNTSLTAIRGLNGDVTPSQASLKEAFTLTISATADSDYLGLYLATTAPRTLKLTALRLMPL